uniref:Uncharacterized protein n=1 Tax=Arundo donax TaxID=35708 RepID=A0A0A9HPH4_ARUDO
MSALTFALKEFFVSLCQLNKPSTTPFKCS